MKTCYILIIEGRPRKTTYRNLKTLCEQVGRGDDYYNIRRRIKKEGSFDLKEGEVIEEADLIFSTNSKPKR